MRYRKLLVVVSILLLTLIIGCAVAENAETTEAPKEYIVLRILTESSTVDGMKSQILEMMSVFEGSHENVNLVLDVLPADGLERQKAISQIYVDIANGEGPDIYLMPTGSTVSVSSGAYLTGTAKPLFSNITEHMYKGTFADISEYYDADEALGKDGLLENVMDAGVVGDARYALPLRYSIPVIYADREGLKKTPLTEEILNEGIDRILNCVLSSNNWHLAAYVDPVPLHSRYLFNFFSEVVDYETCTLKIDNFSFYQYMAKACSVHIWAERVDDAPTTPHAGSYISTGDFFAENGFPLTVGKLESALDAAAIAKSLGIDLAMIPLRGVTGDLIADVTYFGAVGTTCDHPELAYQFLRMFLSEDAQWEVNRPRSTQGFQAGLIAAGWPVRAEGAAEYLWQNMEFQLGFYVGQDEDWDARASALKAVSLTDGDLDGLLSEVDGARFNNPVEGQVSTGSYTNSLSSTGYAYRITEILALNIHAFKEDLQ